MRARFDSLQRPSRYNQTGPGRIKQSDGKEDKTFKTARSTDLFDGSGTSVKQLPKGQDFFINKNTARRMDLDLNHDNQISSNEKGIKVLWAHRAGDRSGWIPARDIRNGPKGVSDNARWNPRPSNPRGSTYTIDPAEKNQLPDNWRFPNSKGVIPEHGNRASHYGERGVNSQGEENVLLLANLPNIRRGGVAKDLAVEGQRFISAKDKDGHEIRKRVTMYVDGDKNKPRPVTFVYGRLQGESRFGWIALQNLKKA